MGELLEGAMRRRHILLGALALAVVVATIGGVAYVLHTRAQLDGRSYPGLHGPVAVVCPGPPDPLARQGLPAIRPRKDCTPSFTQQDVRAYLVPVRGLLAGSIIVTGQPTVTRIIFLTIGDLRGIGVKWPTDMLVCYAELSGTFTDPSVGPPNTGSAVSIVFDAHTGNELMWVEEPLLG